MLLCRSERAKVSRESLNYTPLSRIMRRSLHGNKAPLRQGKESISFVQLGQVSNLCKKETAPKHLCYYIAAAM